MQVAEAFETLDPYVPVAMRPEERNPKFDVLFKDWRHYVDDMDEDIKGKLPIIFLLKQLLEANTFIVNHALQANGV